MHKTQQNSARSDSSAASASTEDGKGGLLEQASLTMEEKACLAEKEREKKKKSGSTNSTTKKPGDTKSKGFAEAIQQRMEETGYDAAKERGVNPAAEEKKPGGKERLVSLLDSFGGPEEKDKEDSTTEAAKGSLAVEDPEALTPAERADKSRAMHKLYRASEGGVGFAEEDLEVQALANEQEARRHGKGTPAAVMTAAAAAATATKKTTTTTTTTTTTPATEGRARDQLRRLQLLAATKQARTKNEHKQRRLLDRRPKPGIMGGDSSDDEEAAVGRSGVGNRKKRKTT